MSKANRDPITVSNRRRFLRLAASTAAATAFLAPPAVSAATSSGTDPVLVIAAERDRLKAIYIALDARVDAIRAANPAQMWGQGWPRVDRSLDVFKGMPWPDGYNLMREEIERRGQFVADARGKKEGLLKWWDDAAAEMKRLAEVTGYRQASKDLDAAVDAFVDKQCEMADVSATTVAGALTRLEQGVEVVCDDEEPGAYQRMVTGAIADLKRLLAGLT